MIGTRLASLVIVIIIHEEFIVCLSGAVIQCKVY